MKAQRNMLAEALRRGLANGRLLTSRPNALSYVPDQMTQDDDPLLEMTQGAGMQAELDDISLYGRPQRATFVRAPRGY